MNGSAVSPRRLVVVLALCAAVWLAVIGGERLLPELWASLFPTPIHSQLVTERATPDLEAVSLSLDQAVVAAGGDLPPRPGMGEGAVIPLPRGLRPKELEKLLRADPRLLGVPVYVTRADALLWNLRVFAGSELLFRRELRPWLPASPPHPPGNPPELIVLIDLRASDVGRRVLKWKSPLAVILEPFAPPTLRLARDAAKASQAVVCALRSEEPVVEQLQAVPHASAVLVEDKLPESVALDAFLAPLLEAGVTLVDGCPRGCFDAAQVQKAGVPLLRTATALARTDGAGSGAELALARNLAVQWGYGLVLAPGTEDGLSRAEELIKSAKLDGLSVVFVEEAGRLHGLAPLLGGQ